MGHKAVDTLPHQVIRQPLHILHAQAPAIGTGVLAHQPPLLFGGDLGGGGTQPGKAEVEKFAVADVGRGVTVCVWPSGCGTVGGIRINENCQCCDKDFEPIPGLYAAGADACNLYDDSYMFLLPGNSMGFAVNSGRIAGKEAAVSIRRRS